MKNRKGFTLIELLAVIVILGLLMAIAIPSVTKYITESRKKTLTTTVDNYIGALVNEVNDLAYTFTAQNTIYAVPIECIALERGGTDPFGHWHQANDSYFAYVLIQYDDVNSKYVYGFTFKDSAGYGLYPTIQANINEKGSQVKIGYIINKPKTGELTSLVTLVKWQESGFKVDSSTNLVVLQATSENQIGDGISTCTLQQKGDNYAQVEQNKEEHNKPGKVLSGNGTEIGDKICFGSECFYVIESDTTTISMLAEEKIDVTTNNPKQNSSAGNVEFSEEWYWSHSINNELKPEYGSGFPTYVYDNNSLLYPYVEAYEDYLQKELGVTSAQAILISSTQLLELGCGLPTASGRWDSCSNSPLKDVLLRSYEWWTGSPSSGCDRPSIYELATYGIVGNGPYTSTSSGGYFLTNISQAKGVRPIVIVDKSQIKF